MQSVPVGSGETSVQLYLDMQVEIEERANNSIAIYRGPLLYAVEIAHNETETTALRRVLSYHHLFLFIQWRNLGLYRSSGPLSFIETLPNVPASDLTQVRYIASIHEAYTYTVLVR